MSYMRERERQLHRNKFSGMTGQKWFQFVICIFSESGGGGARTLYTHTRARIFYASAPIPFFSPILYSLPLSAFHFAQARLYYSLLAPSPPLPFLSCALRASSFRGKAQRRV